VELHRPLATVTPTLDGDVLMVLARNDAMFTTGQIHRILTQHSEEGIRRVLRRLVDQGIVRSQRIGNAFAYRFSHDHIAAEYVVGLARIQETFLSRLEKWLALWQVPPRYAAVFGSAARGQMAASSDVDLLLVRPNGADAQWETQVHQLAATVAGWLGNDARVLEFSEHDVSSRGRDEPVLGDVLREGLTVAGRRSWLAKQLRTGNA